jgi:hypothetical protein
MNLSLLRTIILVILWPIILTGSIYIDIKGNRIYKLVKGSLVGKISMITVYSMLVTTHSLGLISTVFMFVDVRSVYLVTPILCIWIPVFIWTLKALADTEKEVKKITNSENKS